jgi:hypothetical protein
VHVVLVQAATATAHSWHACPVPALVPVRCSAAAVAVVVLVQADAAYGSMPVLTLRLVIGALTACEKHRC